MANFFQQVYQIVALIPKGKVATYGQIALILGRANSAEAVGWAMRAAPAHLNLPCHRVVNKTGKLAPDHVFGKAEIQKALLEQEGITFDETGRIDMDKHLWQFKTLD